ncbi:heterokaryon incompatibility protein-domain-containing protein [Pyrenochaeta sp. MPI-SDFR-AT-0127]|nr:heterokaryon incompatibility protein-domain-containing protein [Pyrenochaeta sp. MPI-SDFR-AT-0127]
MGNANSRQRITQPLFDAASSLVRRTQIWDKFFVLVQGVKGAVGFDKKSINVSQTGRPSSVQDEAEPSASSSQPVAPQSQDVTEDSSLTDKNNITSKDASPSESSQTLENGEPASDRKDEDPTEDGSQFSARDASEDDRLVDDIKKALVDAAPEPSATTEVCDQPDSGGSGDTEPDTSPDFHEDPPQAESQPTSNSRETYESRVKKVDAARNHLAPNSAGAPKPMVKSDATIDDYDNQVAEYVFSTLMVALPQPHQSTRGNEIVFQPSTHSKPENHTVSANTDPRPTIPPSSAAASVPEKGSSEPEEEAKQANYRKWDRELYSKLSLDRSSIRLVGILPGSPGDNVSVSMDVHPLDKVAMQYEALSYVWGNPEPAKNILVNEVEVPINPNLYDALISLRQPDSTRCIWIDAICLNQTSFAEKSKEVLKMGQIYSLAKTVNVFLGAPSSSDSTSIDTLLKFLNREDPEKAAMLYAKDGTKALENIGTNYQVDMRDVCTGFVETCLQPWWGRIWTLQEFYLSKEEPVWYWGRAHASNAFLKRDFSLLVELSLDLFSGEDANGRLSSDLMKKIAKPLGSFKSDVERISALISRRHTTDGFDTPRRLYGELTAQATNPRDFVYGLRAIFDPVFGRVFVPDYRMRTELLFACLSIFLIQFECWGDVLWHYPSRYAPESGLFPSWLPNFTQHIVPHEFDVQPLDQPAGEKLEPKLVILNHRLHADGYVLDTVYAHRHIDKSDNEKIFAELWQFDHCMNNNHECHEYFVQGAPPRDPWFKVFLDMYGSYYAEWTHFNSAFRGAILQSTMKPEDGDKLPRQVTECMPSWDILQWRALRVVTPGLPEALGYNVDHAAPGYLENIFSDRMGNVFRKTMANFFIGACIFDWDHLSVWLKRFPDAAPWSQNNYWSEIQKSLPNNRKRRAKAVADAYAEYEGEIWSEVMRVSWCYSFYYTFLAYVILLDCDDHASLASVISKLQVAGYILRSIYASITNAQIQELAPAFPSIATRLSHYNTVIELFRGRSLVWTDGGFRGITCPGVEACCDNKSVVAIVDGLSFPLIVRDYDEKTGEGWLAGCALIRGVDMLSKDTEKAALPPDYKRGEKRIFKFR